MYTYSLNKNTHRLVLGFPDGPTHAYVVNPHDHVDAFLLFAQADYIDAIHDAVRHHLRTPVDPQLDDIGEQYYYGTPAQADAIVDSYDYLIVDDYDRLCYAGEYDLVPVPALSPPTA